MSFPPGTPPHVVIERYMRVGAAAGADALFGVTIDTVREKPGGRALCRVTIAPRATKGSELEVFVGLPMAQTRGSPYFFGFPMTSPGRASYFVGVPLTQGGSPLYLGALASEEKTWSYGASGETCLPTESEVGGVVHGTAYFRGAVPDSVRNSQAILLPKPLDCRACRVSAVTAPPCVATPSGDTEEGTATTAVLVLGTMDGADAAEAALQTLATRDVTFTMKDGTIIAGEVGRVHAWKCVVRGADGVGQTVDLLEAAEVTITRDVDPTGTDGCDRKETECPALCKAFEERAKALVPGQMTAAREDRASNAPTTMVVDDLDAVQDAEAMLLRHVGETVTLVTRGDDEITGQLGRVHSAVATIRLANGESRYVKLVEVREVRTGVAEGE